MKRGNCWAAAVFATWGAAWLAAALLGCSPARAADLPLKAPPPAVDFNPFWAEVDALGWSVKGDHLPPLVTTSPVGTPAALAGVLGAPGTTILFGNSDVNDNWRAGGRITAGYWFDPQRSRGIEVSFFDLQDASAGFATDSTANPILAQPFIDATTGLPNSFLSGFPGFIAGAVSVNESSRLLGGGALYRQDLGIWGSEHISALIGYRYLHSSDRLSILSSSSAAGITAAFSDGFSASSDFHGLDLGLAGEWRGGPWSLEWRGKVALGANFNNASINGTTTLSALGMTTTSPGGLLALSSNIGNPSETRFAVVPELSLKAGYQVAPRVQLFAGYDVLYWTDVQRVGGLIDLTVNPNLLVGGPGGGPARPMQMLNTSSLVAQGFSFGVRYNY